MKTIAALSALILCTCAWPDGQASLTISGKGKSGIEVRDASGNVTEVRGASNLRVNQLPPDAIAREEAYRAEQKELAGIASARRAEETAAAAEAQKLAGETATAEAAKAAAQTQAATEAEAAAKLKEAQHPRKIRGKTVRGTRYVANPKPEPENLPAPAGPVLSAVGDQPKEEPPADSDDQTEKP